MQERFIDQSITVATRVGSQKQRITIGGGDKQMMIIYSNIANINGKTSSDITISWNDASNNHSEHFIHHTVAVPADAALNKTMCGLLLDKWDSLCIQASNDDSIDITLTFFEV